MAWVVAYVGIAGYCLSARFRQTKETEYTLFGLLTISLAGMNAGCAALHLASGLEAARFALALTDAGRAAATAILVQAALEEAFITPKRSILYALYGGAALFTILGAFGLFHQLDLAREEPVRVFGIAMLSIRVPAAPLGQVFSWVVALSTLFAGALLGRLLLRRRPGSLTSFLGAVVLLVAVFHDAVLSLQGWSSPLLSPYGYSAFLMGMVMALLSRYSALRGALEARAVDLKQRSRELARSYEDLRTAQSEIVRKEQLAAVGELSAVIAHEVRNPLAILTSAVATLRRHGLSEEDRQTLLGILDEESSRLNRLVGDLLRYARPVRIEQQWISPREIIERAMTLIGERADVTAELVEEPGVQKISGDPMLLRQVVENLISNAVQAMPKGGKLLLRLSPAVIDSVAGVEVEIEDTGEGMDSLVQTRALDPFFTTRASGTGLGLAIVARIVDAHGGRLRISSAAGQGTIVRIFLPIHNERGQQPSDPSPRISSLPPMPIELRKAIGRERKR